MTLLPAIRRAAWRLLARLPASVEHDDLVQAGMLRILERQQRAQDDQAGYLLAVAAGGMLDYLRAGDPLQQSERAAIRRLSAARDRVERREFRPARLAEVAAEAGMEIEDAAQTHDVALCGLDDAADVSADLPDHADALAAVQAVQAAMRRYQRMDPRWRRVVDDWLDETPQTATAAAFGVTKSRVCRILDQAVARVVGA